MVLLIIAAGLNAPLALCALIVAALSGLVPLRPDFVWLQSPWTLAVAVLLLAAQLCADLYFVPITVQDGRYLHFRRMHYAYLHARAQSLFRPLCAALIAAAVSFPFATDWRVAMLGFCGAAAVYWLSAWIREYVARTRGTLVLMALETAKNVVLAPLVALAFAWPVVAIVCVVMLLVPTALWTTRLQREYWFYAPGGGQRAREDT